ncbi:MAG: MFS transporter [Pseudomonadota bacterium]
MSSELIESAGGSKNGDQDRRARKNVWVLVAAQAILGSQIAMILIVGGLAGTLLAPNPCFATLPISMIVFGSMTTAPWLSQFMQYRGRRAGFMLGACAGLTGACICAVALNQGNFPLFLLGSYCTGIYQSSQGFFRFAATDTASESFRPKAISYVLAGGLISAIIGPQIAGLLSLNNADASPTQYVDVYLAAAAINVFGGGLFLALDIPRPKRSGGAELTARSYGEILREPRIASAVIIGAVSYALMTLVMTSTPIAVVGCGFAEVSAANVVSAHVLAMFAPSFFTGHLILRFGVEKIVGLGLFILAMAGVVALHGVTLSNFFVALVLLGLGWNFGFIGATSMLASAHNLAEQGKVQGLNDMIVFGSVTIASLASGGLMNCTGGSPVEGWSMVNLAMAPFLVIAFATLIWVMRKPPGAQHDGNLSH